MHSTLTMRLQQTLRCPYSLQTRAAVVVAAWPSIEPALQPLRLPPLTLLHSLLLRMKSLQHTRRWVNKDKLWSRRFCISKAQEGSKGMQQHMHHTHAQATLFTFTFLAPHCCSSKLSQAGALRATKSRQNYRVDPKHVEVQTCEHAHVKLLVNGS